jgi:hypothetical protein
MKYTKSLTALVISLIAVAMSGPVFAKDKLKIELREWNITMSEETIEAGEVDVYVKNYGDEEHELVFMRLNTDMATGRLPVGRHGGIDEDNMTFAELVGEIEELSPRKRAKETFFLKPGRYAVICNMIEEEPDGEIEAHYSMGMHALLNVE